MDIRTKLAEAAGRADAKVELFTDEDQIRTLRIAIVLFIVIGVLGTLALTDVAGAAIMALAYGTIVLGVYLGSRGTDWISNRP